MMKASVLSVLFLVGSAMSACTDPKVTASSYTPADSQVLTAIPFIAEFSLVCGNGEKPALYADIDGVLVPVTQSIEGDKYQVCSEEKCRDLLICNKPLILGVMD